MDVLGKETHRIRSVHANFKQLDSFGTQVSE